MSRIYLALIFLCFLSGVSINAQRSTIYYNLKGEEVSRRTQYKEFDLIRSEVVPGRKSDSISHRYYLVPRVRQGILSSEEHQGIKDLFTSRTGSSLPKKYTLIMYYYPMVEKYDKKYLNKIDFLSPRRMKVTKYVSENPNTFVLHIVENNNEFNLLADDKAWFIDEKNVLKDLFFDYYYRHGSYVVINEVGKFYVLFGEHVHESSTDVADELRN